MRANNSIQTRVFLAAFTLAGVSRADAQSQAAPSAAPAPASSTSAPAPAAAAPSAQPPSAAPEAGAATPPAPSTEQPLASAPKEAAKPARLAAQPARRPGAPLTPEGRQQARQRFNRGLELYDAADYAGALREFQGALDVMRHPIVLYNVALVYAQLGLPVECTKTVEELQQLGAEQLDTASREHLNRVYEEQRGRIGKLRVRANVPGAVIQVDGLDLGQNSLEDLSVASGEHVVSTVASGYIPRRMRVFVPARAEQEVSFTLQPLQSTLAHLQVVTNVPDVEVLVDGEPVGKTPFPASLAFAPGVHEVTLRRVGYIEQKQKVVLDPGGEGNLKFELLLDPNATATHGVLALNISEPNSMVSVNNKVLGIGQPRLQLPTGRHRLLVHSAGFVDYETDVWVKPGEVTAKVEMMPTSEFLKQYEAKATSQRTLGWVGLGAGAALALGGGGFLIWNGGQLDAAEQDLDAFVEEVRRTSPSRKCTDATCAERVTELSDSVDSIENRAVFGWVGVGLGAAVSVASVGLVIWGDDPEKYAPRHDSDVFGAIKLDVQASPTGARAFLSAQF